jgi:NADH-quinone oxidoreductase subunit C
VSPLADYQTRIRESFPEAVVDARTELGAEILVVATNHILDVGRLLRDEFGFDMLVDVSAVDWFGSQGAVRPADGPRYDVNYQLLAVDTSVRLSIKAQLPDVESPHIASLFSVWPAADWHEREVYDFFGIVFDGHPNLRRILMPDEWIGHPLRKDYPVGGVPVEYKIEPAYVGANLVPSRARPAAGGVPARLRRDRGRLSHWTWSGPPATDVRREIGGEAPTDEPNEEERKP